MVITENKEINNQQNLQFFCYSVTHLIVQIVFLLCYHTYSILFNINYIYAPPSKKEGHIT